jgi:hypothetical protein
MRLFTSTSIVFLVAASLALTIVGRPRAAVPVFQGAPTLSINDVSSPEGNPDTHSMIFTVTLTGAHSAVSVDYATEDGPPPNGATAGSDYMAASGTLSFPASSTSATRIIPVTVLEDRNPEPDETFFVNLSNATGGATIADGQGLGTIVNDDGGPAPMLSISDVFVNEGNAGAVNAVFTVTLSSASASVVTVDFATADGTATVADNDYQSRSGTVTFPANDTTPKSITVPVVGDTNIESDETFFVNLSNATGGATIGDGQGLCTIINDDAPALSINDVSVTEGDTGTIDAVFTVSLSMASPNPVTVNYATADGTATVADNDYQSRSGTVTFPASDASSKTIAVPVVGDTSVEPGETFFVNLTGASGATIADGQGVCTIVDDDSAAPLPALSVNDISVGEGNAGAVNAVFTVSLSAASTTDITVNYATADGTATVADNDYQSRSGVLTFPANDPSPRTITVSVLGDVRVEPNENFFLNLANPSGATIADSQGVCTIFDDDGAVALPTVYINDVSLVEGDAGKANAIFVLTLSEESTAPVTVDFATGDGTATSSNNDYEGRAGTATIPAFQITAAITVPVVADTSVEPNETFFVDLTRPVGAILASARGMCTIINDDGTSAQPTIFFNSINRMPLEGDTGNHYNFEVSLSGVSRTAVTVNYATADGTATVADNDYEARSGILTFPANDSTPQFIRVPIIGDTRYEPNEIFFLRLSGATGATIANDTAGCIIINDDNRCSYSISPNSQSFPVEGGTGSFAVSVSSDCDWFVDPLISTWVTITSGASGTGNGTVTYTVRENAEDGLARDDLIRVFERNTSLAIALFRITQDPIPCTYSVNPSSLAVGPSAYHGVVEVTSPDHCPVESVSDVPWISVPAHLDSTIRGASVPIVVEANPGVPRTGTATIAGQRVTVRQAGSCPASAYAISPAYVEIGGFGALGSIAITAPADCTWRATTETDWIHLDRLASPSGVGSGTVEYLVDVNGSTPRGGLILINGEIQHRVYQEPPVRPGSNCIFDFVCHFFPEVCGGQSSLAQARSFRDNVLARSERGRRYTRLYYQLSTEAIGVVMLNPALILRSREMLERYRPVLASMIKGEPITLTRADVEDIDNFLKSFADKGSSEMRETLNGLRQDLRDPEVHKEFNITITEGPVRDLHPQSQSQNIKHRNGLSLVFGFLACGFLLRVRRSKGRKAALSILLPFLLIGPQASAWQSSSSQHLNKASSCAANLQGPIKNMLGASNRTESRGRASVSFEANSGQADPSARFILRSPHYTLYLSPAEAVLSPKPGGANRTKAAVTSNVGTGFPADCLRMQIVDANPDSRLHGLDQLPGRTNYFGGRDPDRWRTNVPSYSRVKYDNVYNGVDLVFHGSQQQLEYDFEVAAGADPNQIRLRFDGSDDVAIEPGGDFVVRVPGAELRQQKPIIYQVINGEKRFVEGRYVIHRDEAVESRIRDRSHVASVSNRHAEQNERRALVGFQIGAYDHSRPLVIDPILQYSTYFGGGGSEEGTGIAVDASGNTYVTGLTDSVDFPLANPSQANLGGGQQDAFVSKLDPSGQLIYSTYIGGNGKDNSNAIAVDAAGNAYVTGFTDSTNFPVRNALQERNKGAFNAFVTKLSPTGVILNSTLLGGSVSDFGSGIAVDASGNVYAAGISTSPDFPFVAGIQQAPGGLVDGYVAKIDTSGRLVYSTLLGGAGIDAVTGIAADSQGSIYLTGLTSSTDFKTENAEQPALGGGVFDAFVMKLSSSGAQVVYSTYLGGSGEDRAFRIVVDSEGNAYITGDTDSADFPTVNALQPTKSGTADAFVAKLNPTGSALLYSTYLGGNGIDGATALAVDSAGEAHVTGFTNSNDFPTVDPIQTVNRGGVFDAFVSKLSRSGSALEYSTYLGGSGSDAGFCVALEPGSDLFVLGLTDSVDFPTMNASQPATGGGASDLFIARISAFIGPHIVSASIEGKKLIVTGRGFEEGSKVLLNGKEQKTKNDAANPTTSLIAKKAGKKIPTGTSTLQVRNPDGKLSNEFSLTRD